MKQQLLTKLAMDLAEWPAPRREGISPPSPHEYWKWERPNCRCWELRPKHGSPLPGHLHISEQAWRRRREHLIAKPSWSDAPDWATHLIQDPNGPWYWVKNFCGLAENWQGWISDRVERACHGHIPAGHDWRETVEARPAEPEWDGEGYPAVGVECEYRHKAKNSEGWHVCQVMGYFGDWIWVALPDRTPHSIKAATFKFRPIRSEEDHAVDAMMAIYHANNSVDVRDAMRDIYRAGLVRLP